MRWSEGITTWSNEIVAVSEARWPIKSARPSIRTPAWRGTTNTEMPSVPLEPFVRANTVYQSAWLALVMKHFVPSSTQLSPSWRAVVSTPDASEPACASVRQNDAIRGASERRER